MEAYEFKKKEKGGKVEQPEGSNRREEQNKGSPHGRKVPGDCCCGSAKGEEWSRDEATPLKPIGVECRSVRMGKPGW